MTLPRDRLVLRLNEIYHDLENREYDTKHPDIEEGEPERWRRAGSELVGGERPALDILDVGCGTGFVPLQWKDWLRPEDRLICADLSEAMLEACRANLEREGVRCRPRLLKLDGRAIDLPDGSLDVVTLNAVLHHVPRPESLCREIDRVLKPGGQVLIGHEPNRRHLAKKSLAWNYWLLLPFADWKLFGYEILLSLGWFEFLRKPLGRRIPELGRHNRLLDAVNARLLAAGDISKPLAAPELSALLDVHSPTAGGRHAERGFDFEDFTSGLFPGYRMESRESYQHLNKIRIRNGWLRRYQGWLEKRFPEDGACLSCRLRKPK